MDKGDTLVDLYSADYIFYKKTRQEEEERKRRHNQDYHIKQNTECDRCDIENNREDINDITRKIEDLFIWIIVLLVALLISVAWLVIRDLIKIGSGR